MMEYSSPELMAIRNALRAEFPRLNLGSVAIILAGNDLDYTEDEIFAVRYYYEQLH